MDMRVVSAYQSKWRVVQNGLSAFVDQFRATGQTHIGDLALDALWFRRLDMSLYRQRAICDIFAELSQILDVLGVDR